MKRLGSALIASVLAGLLVVGGLYVVSRIIAQAGHDTVKSFAPPGTAVAPASKFMDSDSFRKMAPWFFVLGAGSTFMARMSPPRQQR